MDMEIYTIIIFSVLPHLLFGFGTYISQTQGDELSYCPTVNSIKIQGYIQVTNSQYIPWYQEKVSIHIIDNL